MTKITIEDENNKYEFNASNVTITLDSDTSFYTTYNFKIKGTVNPYNCDFINHTKVTPTKLKEHPLPGYCMYCQTTPCKLYSDIEI